MVCYPNLNAEIARRGIRKNVIAKTLGITDRALRKKMGGETNFTWPEVCKINEVFFPDMNKEILFENTAALEQKTED